MSGYTRQSAADIVPTAVVRAAPINAELNALRDAFDFDATGSTGHKHDGTADEGSYVPLIADIDGLNKVVIDTANNRVQFFVEVSSAATEQLRIQDGVIVPVTDNDIDLGTSSVEFKNAYIDGTAFIDTVSVGDTDNTVITDNAYTVTGSLTFDVSGNINLDADGGNVVLQDAGTTYATLTSNSGNFILKSGTTTAATFTGANTALAGTLYVPSTATVDGAATLGSTLSVAGNASFNANMTLGNDVLDTITYSGRVSSAINPSADSTYDLGTTSLYWANAYIDAITTTGNVAVGGNATVTGTLSVTSNTALSGNLTINGNTVIGNATTDTVTVTAEVASAVVPSVDSTYALGSSSKYWSHGYIDAITTTGNVTVSGAMSVGATLDMTNGQINNLAAPTLSSDAATKGYVDTAINNVIDAAPGTLDTLNELAAALGDDPNFATTVTNSIATKLALAGGTMSGNIAMGGNTITGLATPVNTSDAATKGYIDTIFGDTASAAASAAAAAASYDSFDDRYLGAKSSAPSVDNDGNALLTGALYFDTTGSAMKVWSGSAWLDAYASLSGALIASNNLSDLADAATARQNLGVDNVVFSTGGTMTGDLVLNDNNKLKLGTGGDLELYHTGTNSFIQQSGTGRLTVLGYETKMTTTGAGTYFENTNSGYGSGEYGVKISHITSGSTPTERLRTTNSGVVVSGLLTGLSGGIGQTGAGTTQTLRVGSGGIAVGGDSYFANSIGVVTNITAGGTVTATSFSGDGSALTGIEAFNTQTASTSSTAQTAIATYAVASYDGVKAVITVADSTAGERTITEMIITHDGTTAVATEYAIVNTDTTRATFDVDISGGNIRILATPVSSNSMSFTVKAITL